jgi:hypothetical protein
MSAPAPAAEGFSALSPASVGGRRRSHKKLRLVKKRTVKRMLKKMGLKLRGGAAGEVTGDKVVDDKAATGAVVAPAEGGRRRRRTGRKGKKSRKVFGLF